MFCTELAELLTEFLEGELSPEQTEVAVDHLASCPHCETVLSQTQTIIDGGREYGRVRLADSHRSGLLASILDAEQQ